MANQNAPTIARRDFLTVCLACALPLRADDRQQTLYAVPNFHPGCMGWLAPYHVERNYCLYSYLDHQDLALRDPEYRYGFSEIPHLITMMEYEPARVDEFKGLIQKGQAELVNAFVLEPTINLSGGEALVMQGAEGLRWYTQVMNVRPRHCWMIDITGFHEQMAQIVNGLGLDSFVYCRYNPTVPARPLEKRDQQQGEADGYWANARGDAVHWIESPDGTRAIAVSPGHYSGPLRDIMMPTTASPEDRVLASIRKAVTDAQAQTPPGMPLLALPGQGDYSLSFNYKGYPREALRIWEATKPSVTLRFSTLSDWFEAVKPLIASGK